nr:DNA methyltransferase [Armatimonas rosea]
MREKIPDESVDLCYIDPPFNSARNYFVIFKDRTGDASQAQEAAFVDTWNWSHESEYAMREFTRQPNQELRVCMEALHTMLKESPMMAYLVSMAQRFIEIHRVLKPTGSFYLHCDPTASHYLKIVLDTVFGPENFRSEVIWKRTNSRSTSGKWPRLHDVILQYSCSTTAIFHSLQVPGDVAKMPHTLITGIDGLKYQTFELTAPGVTKDGESGKPWRGHNPTLMGRHWANNFETLDNWDAEGLIHWPKNGGFPRRRAQEPFQPTERVVTVGDVWTDIDRINQSAKERLGYPTQKPLALLRRIIEASSNPGDVVLDCYCGCGTTVHAAHELGRRWVGIDITPIAVSVIKTRLEQTFDGLKVPIDGFPTDYEGARTLFETDPYRFQTWACTLVGAYPRLKKGADRGIDGDLPFYDNNEKSQLALVQVKGGKVGAAQVRDLVGTVQREKAALGLFVCLDEPTKPMLTEAASAGLWEAGYGREYPRIQILPVRALLEGTVDVRMPPQEKRSLLGFKAAKGAVKGKQTAAKVTQTNGQPELTFEL